MTDGLKPCFIQRKVEAELEQMPTAVDQQGVMNLFFSLPWSNPNFCAQKDSVLI